MVDFSEFTFPQIGVVTEQAIGTKERALLAYLSRLNTELVTEFGLYVLSSAHVDSLHPNFLLRDGTRTVTGAIAFDADGTLDIGDATNTPRDVFAQNIKDESGRLALDASAPMTLLPGSNGAGRSTSATAPGVSPTYAAVVTKTITLEYSAQPVTVFAWGAMECSDQDENDDADAYIDIDGTAGRVSRDHRGGISANQSAHNHNHDHTSGSYKGAPDSHDVSGISGGDATSADPAITVTVGDDIREVTPKFVRPFTPAGTTFDIKLMAREAGGATVWDNELMWQVFRGI
jgi:hypothetical protein